MVAVTSREQCDSCVHYTAEQTLPVINQTIDNVVIYMTGNFLSVKSVEIVYLNLKVSNCLRCVRTTNAQASRAVCSAPLVRSFEVSSSEITIF